MRLRDKVAIVTGAAQGIGEAIARKFSSEGAAVVLADINIERAQQVADDLRKRGFSAIAMRTNVAERREVQDMVEAIVEKFSRLDVLVNNAGVVRYASLLEMTEEDWDLVVDVNLKGVFNCTQAVLPHMITRRYGKIINIASIAGLGYHGRGALAGYAASKAGVIELTKVTAREVGRYGINVNCICPGLIVTPLTYASFKTLEEAERSIREREELAVLKRSGTPDEVASLALFLACDDSSFITGQAIRIDGGRTDGM